jgi:hypothetical protein
VTGEPDEIWRGQVLTDDQQPGAFPEASTGEEESRPPRRGRRAALIGGLIGALLVGAGAGYALTRGGTPPPAAKPEPPSTATVTRQNLVNTQQESGNLGYAGTYTVVGQAPGVLTWLPAAGTTIAQGQEVYGVDGHSVPLFYGSTPLYRALSAGVTDGADVRELNQDLRALGYRSAPTGDVFTAGTTDAIKAWQKALGLTQTGIVNPGDVVVEPSSVVVNSVTANPGAPATGSLMTLSSTTKVVTVNLPVTAEGLAAVGGAVQIQLPDNSTTNGHITSVGTIAQNQNSGSGGGGGSGSGPGSGSGSGGGNATIPVTISLDTPQSVGSLTGAPVTVNFTSAEHANVLAVPVGALLALAEGGYAVDVVDPNGHTHLVAVTLGMFANGQVEISGPDVREGMKVEVAGTE